MSPPKGTAISEARQDAIILNLEPPDGKPHPPGKKVTCGRMKSNAHVVGISFQPGRKNYEFRKRPKVRSNDNIP